MGEVEKDAFPVSPEYWKTPGSQRASLFLGQLSESIVDLLENFSVLFCHPIEERFDAPVLNKMLGGIKVAACGRPLPAAKHIYKFSFFQFINAVNQGNVPGNAGAEQTGVLEVA